MFIVLKKCLIGASLVALAFSFEAGNANAATCQQLPSCESLGYTDTSCPSGVSSITCPFESGKLKCIQDCSLYTHSSCPAGATCVSCTSGSTTKYMVKSCNFGYSGSINSNGLTCVANACEGYTLSSCPTGAKECRSCKAGDTTKYQIVECNTQSYKYDINTKTCVLGTYQIGDPYYYKGKIVGIVYATPGQVIGTTNGTTYKNNTLRIVSSTTDGKSAISLGKKAFSSSDPYKCIDGYYDFATDFTTARNIFEGMIDDYPFLSCSATLYFSAVINDYATATGYGGAGWGLPMVGEAMLLIKSGLLDKGIEFWTKDGGYTAYQGETCDIYGDPSSCDLIGVLSGMAGKINDGALPGGIYLSQYNQVLSIYAVGTVD